jgi:hypothetical protein
MNGDCIAFVCGAIPRGTGRLLPKEGLHPLLQDAPVDLHIALRNQWHDRVANIEAAVAALGSPYHNSCYEAPSSRYRTERKLFTGSAF